MNLSDRSWAPSARAVALIACVLLGALPCIARDPSTELAPVQLRGYGKVSGRFTQPDQPPGASVLRIDCESADKARILQSKYLSDLALLPGVKDVALGETAACEIAGQGVIAALRDGARVFILSAKDAADFPRLLSREFPHGVARLASRPEVPVPMFLDRWDRGGWRFYYRLGEFPPDWPRDKRKDYDMMSEFEWAARLGCGFVFWDTMNRVDTAEGLLNDAWWDYAFDAARAKNLPVAINAVAEPGGTPVWLLNRYREQTQLKMPRFVGDFYKVAEQGNGGHGATSWNATALKDAEMGMLQHAVRRFAAESNVVSFLEPHGELSRQSDLWIEYGPVADAGFQRFLKEKYRSLSAVGRRWVGDPRHFKSWTEVRVPELASFLGWGTNAVDLTGAWRMAYEPGPGGKVYSPDEVRSFGDNPVPTDPAPAAWFAPDFDDAAWPSVDAPGNDRLLFWQKRPSVYRRGVEVPSAWQSGNPRTWLYVWDLNVTRKGQVLAFLNGQKVGESETRGAPHWAAFEVSPVLRAGINNIALRVPQGLLAYRVYLSHEPPSEYPNLGAGRNALWVDFSDWVRASRVEMCRRGCEMIRQVDADRQISFMHPDDQGDGIVALAGDYGGEFHNTGYASGFWADYNVQIMQGAGLPTSLEPGSGAKTLPEFRQFMGRYFTEGIQGVDYFIHIGDVLWNDAIRGEFEAINPLVRMIGKYHAPKADVAVLYSTRTAHLTDFPWQRDPNTNLKSGYWAFNPGEALRDVCPRDGVTETAFARGEVAKYRIVMDSNTSIMDDGLVHDIERYVRGGGTFVTFVQSGRHSPEQADAWPISRLTGYRVKHVSRFDAGGGVPRSEAHAISIAPGQEVFTTNIVRFNGLGHGLSLEKVAPDCRDLLVWDDGTVAAGMRQLGKGWIVQLGPHSRDTSTLLALLAWRGVQPHPARLSTNQTPAGPVMLRHWLSNNGLYDVWTLWNQDAQKSITTDLVFGKGAMPVPCIEIGNARPAGPNGIVLQPLQTRIFLTPRESFARAGLDWFELQRSWWRGTKAPASKALPEPPHQRSLDLSESWAWKSPAAGDDPAALAAVQVDDRAWPRMPLRIWSLPDRQDLRHVMLRHRFTVPSSWKNGRVELWIQSWAGRTYADRARVFLDGRMIQDWRQDGIAGAALEELKPGTSHLLALEVQSDSMLTGVLGGAWLWYQPRAPASIDLTGDWSPSGDALRYGSPVHLPGEFQALSLRRTVNVPAGLAGRNAMLEIDASGSILGALVNGRWVRRFHHRFGDRTSLNVTPWIQFGGANEIELFTRGAPDKGTVRSVSLDFHKPGVFP